MDTQEIKGGLFLLDSPKGAYKVNIIVSYFYVLISI